MNDLELYQDQQTLGALYQDQMAMQQAQSGGMAEGLMFTGSLIGFTLVAADPDAGYRIGLKKADGTIPIYFDVRPYMVGLGVVSNLFDIGPEWLQGQLGALAWGAALSLALTEGFAARQTGSLFGMLDLPPWLAVDTPTPLPDTELPPEAPAAGTPTDKELDEALADLDK